MQQQYSVSPTRDTGAMSVGLTGVGQAFWRALVSQFHPRMLFALLLPFLIMLVGAILLLVLALGPLTDWLEQMLSQSGQAAPLDGGASFEVDKQKMQQDFGTAIAALPPLPEQFVLYFVRGGTQLTKESSAVMPKMLARAKERKSLEVWLVGHTDTVGNPKRNEALGLKRAQTIARQFKQLGLKDSALTVESFGERSPQVATPDETNEPRNRRSEITLR